MNHSVPRKALLILLLAALAGLLAYRFVEPARHATEPSREAVRPAMPAGRTVAQVVAHLQPQLESRIQGLYRQAGLTFPPARLTLLAIKDQQRLEVWARDAGRWRHVVDYPFTAFSGTLGPKLREGDGQIPEGLYRIDILNPNSQYHLSMRVSYPNDFDRRMARQDGRTRLGGDIYIHGKSASIGCIAIGDEAIEELFYMVAATGRKNVEVIIAPCDLRTNRPDPPATGPLWVAGLYETIRERMGAYRSVSPAPVAEAAR